MLKKIDHIGIAVESVDAVMALYSELFDLEPDFDEIVEDQNVRAVGFSIGGSRMEYLEPVSTDSPISRFLERRGEGMHHVCFAVENVAEILKRMKEKGLRLIDEQPRRGAEGKQIAFIHPKSLNGVLVELSEDPTMKE